MYRNGHLLVNYGYSLEGFMGNNSDIVPYHNESGILRKSNFLIGMKYKASPTELQCTYMAMLSLQEGKYTEKPDGIYVTMKGIDIKKKLKKMNNHAFYTTLAEAANSMTGRNMGTMNPDKHEFEFITLITKATYKEGMFTVKFAPEMKEILMAEDGQYTSLLSESYCDLNLSWSLKLYETLKRQCFYPKWYNGKKDNVFLVTIGLAELKLILGIVNSNLDSVKKILLQSNGSQEDYEKAVEISPEKMLNSWSEFKRKCLDRAVAEINKNTEIYVEYTPKKGGIGGKVYAVDFTVYLNNKKDNQDPVAVTMDDEGNIQPNLSELEILIFHGEVASIFKNYNLREGIDYDLKSIEIISRTASYNLDVVKDSLDKYSKQDESKIKNPIGWIVSCIKDNYKIVEKNNQFNDFHQRDIDKNDDWDSFILANNRTTE